MSAHPKSQHLPGDNETEAKRKAIAEARSSIAAEGTISHQAMIAWLDSWGTDNELAPPAPCK